MASFKLYGLDLSSDSKVVKFISRPFICVFTPVHLIWSFYRIAYGQKNIPVDITIIFGLFALVVSLRTVSKTGDCIKKIFKETITILSRDEVKKIQKMDMWMILPLHVAPVMVSIFMMAYVTIFDCHEVLALCLGEKVESPFTPAFLAACYTVPTQIFYMSFGFWTSIVYYVMIQQLIKSYASNCLKFIEKAKTVVTLKKDEKVISDEQILKKLLDRFKIYDKITRTVNDSLGILPFIMFAITFVEIMASLCFVSLYNQRFSILFLATCAAVPQMVTCGIMYLSIDNPCNAIEKMHSFKNETIELLTLIETNSLNSHQAKRLTGYLSLCPLVEPCIWSMFNIQRSILFSFIEGIVPFAIMIITTTIEFKSKVHYKA